MIGSPVVPFCDRGDGDQRHRASGLRHAPRARPSASAQERRQYAQHDRARARGLAQADARRVGLRESRAFFCGRGDGNATVVIDHARRRHAQKRGGEATAGESALANVGAESNVDELLAIDAILTKLEALDARLARVVEWRFFGGLDEAEIARARRRRAHGSPRLAQSTRVHPRRARKVVAPRLGRRPRHFDVMVACCVAT